MPVLSDFQTIYQTFVGEEILLKRREGRHKLFFDSWFSFLLLLIIRKE